MTMTHERCSELLGPYGRGELDDATAAAVREHLDGCAECALEARAVLALFSLPSVEISPEERAALRTALSGHPARRPWRTRLAPAFGVAAGLLLLVAAAGVFLTTRDAGSPLQTATDAGGDGFDESEAEAGAGESAPQAESLQQDDAAQRGGAGGIGSGGEETADTTSSAMAAGSGTTALSFADADLTPRLLRGAFASAPDEDAIARLRRAAPSPEWADQIEECASVVVTLRAGRVVPAFVSVYGSDGILVIGFTPSASGGGTYEFWGWRRGTCGVPLPIFFTGTL